MNNRHRPRHHHHHHWIVWGMEPLRDRRRALLLWAFFLNFIAITGITIAAMAIKTDDILTQVAWANANTTTIITTTTTTTTTASNDISSSREDCPQHDHDDSLPVPPTEIMKVQVWLGLRGYYGECQIIMRDSNASGSKNTVVSSSAVSHPHSDTFCSSETAGDELSLTNNSTTTMNFLELDRDDNQLLCTNTNTNTNTNTTREGLPEREQEIWNCELIMTGINVTEDPDHCSSCKDIERSCMGTLLSSAAFGIFPLVLTIRRLCSARREKLLRLRTLFFSGLAIIFGFTAFIRFHFHCIHTIPSFSALIWQCPTQITTTATTDSSSCNQQQQQQQPFLVQSVPMELELYTGGKLVIVAALLKVAYFTLHLITPVHNLNNNNTSHTTTTEEEEEQQHDDEEEEIIILDEERQGLLSSSKSLTKNHSSISAEDDNYSTGSNDDNICKDDDDDNASGDGLSLSPTRQQYYRTDVTP